VGYRDRKKVGTKVVVQEVPAGTKERQKLENQFASLRRDIDDAKDELAHVTARAEAIIVAAEGDAETIRREAKEHADQIVDRAKLQYREFSARMKAEKADIEKQTLDLETQNSSIQEQNRKLEIARKDLEKRQKACSKLETLLRTRTEQLAVQLEKYEQDSLRLSDEWKNVKDIEAELQEWEDSLSTNSGVQSTKNIELQRREQDVEEKERLAAESKKEVERLRNQLTKDRHEFDQNYKEAEIQLNKWRKESERHQKRVSDIDRQSRILQDRERALDAGELKLTWAQRKLRNERLAFEKEDSRHGRS